MAAQAPMKAEGVGEEEGRDGGGEEGGEALDGAVVVEREDDNVGLYSWGGREKGEEGEEGEEAAKHEQEAREQDEEEEAVKADVSKTGAPPRTGLTNT